MGFGTDIILTAPTKLYINTEVFTEYICTVFLPNLNDLHNLDEFASEDIILLKDNCPSYTREEVLDFLQDVRAAS
jgi:hypothetical protein